MPRIDRLKVKGESAVYHVISRTALDGFVLGDTEKEDLLNLIKRLSRVYFAEVPGFCIMGNHFHLLVRMDTAANYDDKQTKGRDTLYYGEEREVEIQDEAMIEQFRGKWEDLSEAEGFLSMDFGLREFGVMDAKEQLSHYRGFVYERGGLQAREKRGGQGLI